MNDKKNIPNIDWCMDIISSNKLYEPILDQDNSVKGDVKFLLLFKLNIHKFINFVDDEMDFFIFLSLKKQKRFNNKRI